LLHDYELTERTTLLLESHLRVDDVDWKPTLFDAMVKSIPHSTYIGAEASGSLSAVIYSVFPIIISECIHVLSGLYLDAAIARKTIDELSEGTLSEETRQQKLDWLNEALGKYIRPLTFYQEDLRVLNSMQRALDDCQILQSRLECDQQVDSDLIKNDIAFLNSYAQQLQRDNEVLFSRRASVLAFTKSTKPPEEHSQEKSPLTDSTLPPAHATASPNSGGTLPQLASGPPPGSPPLDPPAYEPFARHIQTKIDQIAYMTNLLLSLSFIASVYGMNLKIFTQGGEVELSRYLATALPFAFGVLVITFVMPAWVSRFTGGKDGSRRGTVEKVTSV
jgi:hypothetical protein